MWRGLGSWGFLRSIPLHSMVSKTFCPKLFLVSIFIISVLLMLLSVSMLAAPMRNKMYSGMNVEGIRVRGFCWQSGACIAGSEYLQSKRLLGGLLLLLPQHFGRPAESPQSDAEGDDGDDEVRSSISELEQWLVQNTLPVWLAIELCQMLLHDF